MTARAPSRRRPRSSGATKELLRNEALYRGVVEDSPFLICRFLPGGEITYANRAYCRYFDKRPGELIGATFFALIPECDHCRVRTDLAALTVASPALSREHQVIDPCGTFRWHRWTHRALFDGRGKLVAYQAVGEDITDRKTTERERDRLLREATERVKELRCVYGVAESTRRRKTLQDVFRDVVDLIPPGWQYPEITRARIRFGGDEVVSQPFSETPWCQAADIVVGGQCLGTVEVFYVEERPELAEGPFLEEERDLIDSIAHALGESIEHRRTVAALRENERRLSEVNRIVSRSPVIVFLLRNADGWPVEFVSNNVHGVLGYPAEQFLSGSIRFADIVHPNDLRRLAEEFARYSEDKRRTDFAHEPYRVITKGGGIRWLDERTRIRRDSAGGVTHYQGIVLDITERKTLENELFHARKMESIGQLAAGIAHEINTPTQYVGDNTRFLREAFDELLPLLKSVDEWIEAAQSGKVTPELVRAAKTARRRADVDYLIEEIPRAIGESIEGVERVSEIVWAMKEFSHPAGEEKRPLDINRAIESTVTVTRNEWKYVADLVSDLDPGLPLVPCLPREFNQVIVNVIVNAAHTIGDVVGHDTGRKGKISISTRHVDGWAEICISDTGTGIPEHVKTRIFDPFFTTKQVGRGTGQGLSIAHGIVTKKHGGTIAADSEVGRGTTFVIRLPMTDPGEETEKAALSTAARESIPASSEP